jgi:hypothetical protein
MSIADAKDELVSLRSRVRLEHGLAGSKIMIEAANIAKCASPPFGFAFDSDSLTEYSIAVLQCQPE